MRTTILFLGALLVLCSGAVVLGQTPDGMPPALETVCDMESGAAFGWCNAYCEAMDCELANDNDPLTEPKASATACSKVRTKFQQATGRDMPCELSCPCNDPDVSLFFFGYVNDALEAEFCLTEPALGITDGVLVIGEDFEFPFAFSVLVDGQWLCGATNETFALPITPEQGLYCAELVEQAANRQGLICGAPPV